MLERIVVGAIAVYFTAILIKEIAFSDGLSPPPTAKAGPNWD